MRCQSIEDATTAKLFGVRRSWLFASYLVGSLGLSACSLLISTSDLDSNPDAGSSTGADSSRDSAANEGDATSSSSSSGGGDSGNADVVAVDGGTFCGAHPTATFCEDFEADAGIARWKPSGGASVVEGQSLDSLVFKSPTRSLRTELPASPAEKLRFLDSPLLKATSSIHFEVSLNLTTTMQSVSPILFVMQDSTNYGELAITVRESAVGVVQYWSNCGQAMCSWNEPEIVGSFSKRWFTVALDVDLPPVSKVSIGIDGASPTKFDLRTSAVKDPDVHIGAGIWAISGTTDTPTKSNIDDVLFVVK